MKDAQSCGRQRAGKNKEAAISRSLASKFHLSLSHFFHVRHYFPAHPRLRLTLCPSVWSSPNNIPARHSTGTEFCCLELTVVNPSGESHPSISPLHWWRLTVRRLVAGASSGSSSSSRTELIRCPRMIAAPKLTQTSLLFQPNYADPFYALASSGAFH